MKPVSSSTKHAFAIERQPQDNWPDLRWPEWKPGTDKSFRPNRVTFSITESVTESGSDRHDVSSVNVRGPRILKEGNSGAIVTAIYYGFEASSMPGFVARLVSEALEDLRALPVL